MTAPTDRPFWTFSLTLYGQPGIEPLCLRLQDTWGADINLCLYALWAGAACGHVLTELDVTRLNAALAPWRTEIIAPLRRIRRLLKTGPPPAPDAQTETLRQTIKSAELNAERIAQDLLFRSGGLVPLRPPPPVADAAARAAGNLRLAVGSQASRLDHDTLEQLSHAAAAVACGSHETGP